MPEQTEQEIKDPMDLSAEEYEATVSELISTPQDEVEEVDEEQQLAELESTDEPDVETKTEESDEELFEIVYKGEVKKLPRSKVKELAQKGFSYHADMNRIAPHKKIVELIESDEEIGKMVNDYVAERVKPKMTRLDDYESEEAWLEDNLKRQRKAEKFSQVQPPSPGQEIIAFFRDKDPENYETVLKAIGEHAEQLTVAEYKKINESMEELEAYYDRIKDKVVSGSTSSSKPKQTFRTRSGGGAPPRPSKSDQKAWEMSSKDFNQMIQKVKGY